MGRLFDLQIDFFRPLWRRVLLVMFCLVWALVEFVTMAPFWGMVFGGLGVLAFWQFFMDGWPESKPATESEAGQDVSEGDE